MKIYDYKLTKSLSWCLVLCMSLFFMTNSVSAQDDISCDDQVNVSVSANCDFLVAPGLFTEGANDGAVAYFSDGSSAAIGTTHSLECGTYTVTVEDASGNSCWGTVVVEDKLPPASVNPCPADQPCRIDCISVAAGKWPATDLSMYTNSLTDCSGIDEVAGPIATHVSNSGAFPDCRLPDTLYLVYNPIDGKGNVGADTLTYVVDKITLGNLVYPPPVVTADCDDNRCPGDAADAGTDLYGFGTSTASGVVYIPESAYDSGDNCKSGTSQVCDLLFGYQDLDLPACGSDCDFSVKIVRTWTILDWCSSSNTTYTQVIHMKDDIAPTIDPFDVTVELSVDPWLCVVEEITLPEPDMDDTCNPSSLVYYVNGPEGVVIDLEGGRYVVKNAPKGTHRFDYYAKDCCGNISNAQTLVVTIYDGIAPVAIAKQFTVVSLSNVPGNEGTAKMFAESLDNGSYDRCTDVHLEIRRDGLYDADNGSTDLDYTSPHNKVDQAWCCPSNNPTCTPVRSYPCDEIGNDTYNTDYVLDSDGFPTETAIYNGHSWDLPAGCNRDIDPDHGRYVKFCCADLEAATVDVNYDGVNDQGYVKVWLRVWDNADMSMDDNGNPTYGTDGDFYNETWGFVKVEVSAPPTISVDDATINCDWPFEEKWEEDPDYFTTGGWADEYVTTYGICNVQVTAVYTDFYVDDVCPGGYYVITYTATNPDSKGLSAVANQRVYVEDLDEIACEDINWPDSYRESDCMATAEQPYLDWQANACALVGWTYRSDTFRFESDACVKIINEYTVVDWCKFDATHPGFGFGYNDNYSYDESGYNSWYFEGGNDYFDGLLCSDPNIFGWSGDSRTSDNGVFKCLEVSKIVDHVAPEIEVQDTMYAITTLNCYRSIQLEATASDGSDDTCPATWFKWEITIDYDKDGEFEDEFYQYTRDRFGAPLRGATLEFVPWYYTNTGTAPWIFNGPMDSYDVRYIVYDGCGNVDKEIRNIMIVDKKPPTPYCVSLSSAVMDNGQVELWAYDFDQGSTDNCSYVVTTFNEEHPVKDPKTGQPIVVGKWPYGHYFKGKGEAATAEEYNNGDAQWWPDNGYTSSKIFDCDDVAASPVNVKMTAWDSKWNSDYCFVELTLIDNQGGCGDGGARAAVSGNIATEENSDVSEVEVTLENLSNPEYELSVTTGNDGEFAFASNPMYNGYDISAVKDGDDTEGVSTLDLVLIQRHILGITPFDSPYKVIAADINSDRRVSGTDLVVLRKTILGIYKEFPTNNSWRFVEGAQTLTVETALTDFNEVINISDLDANMLNEDFVAVKIGDVNATAKTNARDLGTQTRSAGTISLGLTEQNVIEGQTIDLTFSSSDFNKVYGYQFTLELNGLTIESVVAGDASMSDANIGILDKNTVTVSYSDMEGLGSSDNLFTLTAVATESGSVSNMVSLTNSVLNSEGYVGEGLDIHTIELTVNGEEANSFRLDQNEPNPFDEVTVVGFVLPESGNATLTVYDVAGRVVTNVRGAFAQGYNEIQLTKEDLKTTGVLYYTLKSGDFSATKKMIIIE